ncbi:hypothetical protein J6590_008826 [Homalodisca vitripennis]|nr:hypothetical protein J6590_008826 [Homalodisca vitripennis]
MKTEKTEGYGERARETRIGKKGEPRQKEDKRETKKTVMDKKEPSMGLRGRILIQAARWQRLSHIGGGLLSDITGNESLARIVYRKSATADSEGSEVMHHNITYRIGEWSLTGRSRGRSDR